MFKAVLGPRELSYVAATAELAAELSSATLPERVATIARQLGEADHASVVLFDPEGEVADMATGGVEFERRSIDRGTFEKSVLGSVVERQEPLRAICLADDPALFGMPRDHGDVSLLGAPIVLGGSLMGVLWIARGTDAPTFSEEDERLLTAFATQAGLAMETAALRQKERARRPLAEAVRAVSHALLEGRSTDDVLRLIVDGAAKLLDVAVASLVTSGPAQVAEVRMASGRLSVLVEGLRFPLAGSITGHVMRTQRPFATDAAADHRTHQPLIGLELGPAVFVPLLVGDEAIGTLAAANEVGGRTFAGDDVAVLEAFAAEASIALRYGDIRNELERLALLEERERIAMELHDGVIQALFVVGLSLQAAEERAEDPEQMRAAVVEAVESIDGTIRDLREYIYGLQPADQGDRHLERALRELVETVDRSGPASVSIDLDSRAATALASKSPDVIQAAREALSNALRHSQAQHITLTFRRSGGEVVLQVADNGIGFDMGAPRAGRGLGNLRSRANAMGGVLDVETDPGRGTRVTIRVNVQ